MAARRRRRKAPDSTAPQSSESAAPSAALKIESLTDQSRTFWLLLLAIVLLLIGIKLYRIDKPFYGVHSWAQAHGAWHARCHVNYGLSYTHGMATWAVGNPPTETPTRYVDHPQLPILLRAAWMAVLGTDEWAIRTPHVVYCALNVFVLVLLLRKLAGNRLALLTGLLFTLFPLTGYFGGWDGLMFLTSIWAIWRYLNLIGYIDDPTKHRFRRRIELALALFLMIQLSWLGFFYAFVIGAHYVLRLIFTRKKPDIPLLTILILAPGLSMTLNLLVMFASYDFSFDKILELYRWRSAKGERDTFQWSAWFAKIWEYSRTNHTLPALILFLLYIAYLIGASLRSLAAKATAANDKPKARFIPIFWYWLFPGLLFLLVFRGLVWEHQYWLRPFLPLVSIGTALGILVIGDAFKAIRLHLLGQIVMAVLLIVVAVFCFKGLLFYHNQTWQTPQTVELFRYLHEKIPPDKAMLSFKDFRVQQHASKGAHYRPEYAWYLDRDILTAATTQQVQQAAATGRFPYYYVPYVDMTLRYPPNVRSRLKAMSYEQLDKLMQGTDVPTAQAARNEMLWRHTSQVLVPQLKQIYEYEFFGDPASPGVRGNTPGYIFKLN